jgi:hypothetical protein
VIYLASTNPPGQHGPLLAAVNLIPAAPLDGGRVRRADPQEAVIPRLARGGSNSELGSWLFISARTVHYHLHKVFAKLAINSRRQIRVLPDDTTATELE